jgi:hypothetical protein
MQSDLERVCGISPPQPPPKTNSSGKFYVLNASGYRALLREDWSWAVESFPFVDLPDDDIMTAYYYRVRSYRKHITYTGAEDGFVVTEFLPYVPWSGKHNTIPAAAGHHIAEGRWLHDARVLDDYIAFWYSGTGSDATTYTNWIGAAAWERALVTGNSSVLEARVTSMAELFRSAYVPYHLSEFTDAAGTAHECWAQSDGADAMEVSISGSGCRPTIAAAMFAEARAIARIARLIGNTTLAAEFEAWQRRCREAVLRHWNPQIDTFAVIPLSQTAANAKPNAKAKFRSRLHADEVAAPSASCNLSALRVVNRTVAVRELLGLIPFFFSSADDGDDSLLSQTAAMQYESAWEALFDDDGFAAPWGLRTAERRSACYNYSWDHGDCWNGPSWPYAACRS